MVYLIGAGPGDPGLLTVRALDILRRADVVLYDRLIDMTLLAETKPECLLVDVGKSAGKHIKTQNETTELLVEYGRRGLVTARLKGGDPFLFGRGAEEAERLKDEGIPFAVVPGVSALNAATTYAGIPITHRDYASTFGVATGHGARGKAADPVRWRELAVAVDTIVVFMGVGTIGAIAEELAEGGLPGDTPAAVVEQGTTPAQRVVTGTLATIADAVAEKNVSPPALLVIGRTAALAGTLQWYDPGPLAGMRIGITRPLKQSLRFANRLRELGARPIPMPTIATVDTIVADNVEAVMKAIHDYDYVVYSSVNGVESFFRALKMYGGDARSLAGATCACIGPVTAKRLGEHGVTADITAERYIAEGLAEAICGKEQVEGQRFLLVRSDIGRETLHTELVNRGAHTDSVTFYSTRLETLKPHILEMIKTGNIDAITFTSSSTVNNFFAQVAQKDLPASIKLASIGPQTSEAIRSHGKHVDIEAGEYTTAGLAEAIVAAWGKTT